MNEAGTVALPFAALIAAFAAIYGAGVLRGRFDKHEQDVERRVNTLEDINASKVTREEMNARFDGTDRELRDLRKMVERLLDTLAKHIP